MRYLRRRESPGLAGLKVLLLGATGSIGVAVADALLLREHEVSALARSDGAAARLSATGVESLRGDMRAPERWIAGIERVDAVVHAATEFASDDATVDRADCHRMVDRAWRELALAEVS